MKSILIIISTLLINCAYAQTDSVLVMIEDQLVLVLKQDFETTEFTNIAENYTTEKQDPKNNKMHNLKMELDKVHIHYSILKQPFHITSK